MLSAFLMLRRLAAALRVALREEDFERVLSAGSLLIVVGTITFTLSSGWSVVDGFYVAVATLATSSILDPKLTITDPWLKVFMAFYVLVGIGILVEIARRLGMGFIAARAGARRRELEGGGRAEIKRRFLKTAEVCAEKLKAVLRRARGRAPRRVAEGYGRDRAC
jgi:hypothetical protein